MPRKGRKAAEAAPRQTGITAVTIESPRHPPAASPMERPAWIDGPPTATSDGEIAMMPLTEVAPPADREAQESDHGKNWGDPYKPIFSSAEKGFEMGENRRFKQRVFMFKEKPDQSVLDLLKDNGFTYRAAEKAWTIPATPETRRMSEELAHELAGESQGRSR